MKRYTVEVRMPSIYTVEVEAMSKAEAESQAIYEVEGGMVDIGEGEADGLAVAVSVEVAS
jgi:hypothetical protein